MMAFILSNFENILKLIKQLKSKHINIILVVICLGVVWYYQYGKKQIADYSETKEHVQWSKKNTITKADVESIMIKYTENINAKTDTSYKRVIKEIKENKDETERLKQVLMTHVESSKLNEEEKIKQIKMLLRDNYIGMGY